MDPTKEFSAIIGDLGVQVAILQAQNRVLQEEVTRLKAQLPDKNYDKNT